jgi:hypothetical protein
LSDLFAANPRCRDDPNAFNPRDKCRFGRASAGASLLFKSDS